MARMPLKEVDKVEILTLLDNTIDILMAGTPQARRFPMRSDAFTREKPRGRGRLCRSGECQQ